MALIDVSELLFDPDFTDEVQLIRRARSVNEHGENVLTDAPAGTVKMVVQPAKPSDLLRLPEGAQLRETVSIWYAEPLYTERMNGYADVVVWKGARYTVKEVDDFGQYGHGYTKALAIREKPNA